MSFALDELTCLLRELLSLDMDAVVRSTFLSKFDRDGSRLISNEILHLTLGHVLIHEFEHVVSVTTGLGKFDGNRSRLVGDEVFHLALCDVLVHKLEDIVSITRSLSELHSNGGRLVRD